VALESLRRQLGEGWERALPPQLQGGLYWLVFRLSNSAVLDLVIAPSLG
jgi:hypothetical protein